MPEALHVYLPWIALGAPLVAVAIIGLATRPFPALSALVSVLASGVSFAAALGISTGTAPAVVQPIPWLRFPPSLDISIGLSLDGWGVPMLLVVTGVAFLIHVYSLGYMAEDSARPRYFAGLSLFLSSMIGIILADNLVVLFAFWELVGVSSYLLIGHWFARPAAADAATKAFLVNRLADVGFLLGILLLWSQTGTVALRGLADALAPGASPSVNPALVAAAAILVACGAAGKSAQFPFHVWLPDAMEGPTPVSALIHAATMVAAGVYLLTRVGFLLDAAPPWVRGTILAVGLATSLGAALVASQQDDIKLVLAFSTLSQLGLMFAAIGLAAGLAAMFHLFTHAFFKALLFLAAGAVIHSLHHEQEIWRMGGLWRRMPVTATCFAVGTFAIVGAPGLSGAFSKHEILVAAFERGVAPFAAVLAISFLTSFYMFRLLLTVFLGEPLSQDARRAREAPAVMLLPLLLLATLSVIAGYAYFAKPMLHIEEHERGFGPVESLALAVFLGGFLLALPLYLDRRRDPIRIPALAARLYFDEIYRALIVSLQDAAAAAVAWFDRRVLDGIVVRGSAALAWTSGFTLRFFHFGALPTYALLLGAGLLALLLVLMLA